jgi:deoxycytidylate deaminase
MLINAGIREVVISAGYPDEQAMDLLRQAKVKVRTQPFHTLPTERKEGLGEL